MNDTGVDDYMDAQDKRIAELEAENERIGNTLHAEEVKNYVLEAENERLRKVMDAATCIRHWHDREPDGMVVSAEHVRKLWAALDAAREGE